MNAPKCSSEVCFRIYRLLHNFVFTFRLFFHLTFKFVVVLNKGFVVMMVTVKREAEESEVMNKVEHVCA